MKAAVVERYGPPEVVQIRDVPTPEPAENEILVRSRAVTVNSGDARVRASRVPFGMKLPFRLSMGWNGPKKSILGIEVAGDIVAVGARVNQFKPGDRVVASRAFEFGCHAEYVCVAADAAIAIIPDTMSHEDAVSLLFGGFTSMVFLENGALKSGESLLINGASGAVGVMAIQLAKHIGAEVTAVCSGKHAELVRSLGADHVIDYAEQDFTTLSDRYDVIMDTHGNAPYSCVKHLLKPGGRFLQVIGNLWEMISGKFNKAIISADQDDDMINAAAYRKLIEMGEKGILKPVIEKTFPFAQIAEAHRLVDTGHKAGSAVVVFDAQEGAQ